MGLRRIKWYQIIESDKGFYDALCNEINGYKLLLNCEELELYLWDYPILLDIQKGKINEDPKFEISLVGSFEKKITLNSDYLKTIKLCTIKMPMDQREQILFGRVGLMERINEPEMINTLLDTELGFLQKSGLEIKVIDADKL
ncbi:hypothetical protein J4465_01395 [Candidatus Pacearchaeota archaeon]|nr:hypothetical protein [Candidatus Pacearchaeota archaeon]